MRRAVFLDRDGAINKVLLNNNKACSPSRFEEFEFVPAIAAVLRSFKESGFINIVITNQPDISRGLMKPEELEKMHRFIREKLAVDDIFVCPHSDEDNCLCRKPKTEMFYVASRKWGIDINSSFMIGDSWRDIEAAKIAGCKTIIIDTTYNRDTEADYRVADIVSAMRVIVKGTTQ
jgi:D-glycero-D-manno-heptose 1,7-bisphosphate phosphatase